MCLGSHLDNSTGNAHCGWCLRPMYAHSSVALCRQDMPRTRAPTTAPQHLLLRAMLGSLRSLDALDGDTERGASAQNETTDTFVCTNSQLQIHVERLRMRRALGCVCTCNLRLRGVFFCHSFIMILIRDPPRSLTFNSKVHCAFQIMLPLLPRCCHCASDHRDHPLQGEFQGWVTCHHL